MKSSKSSQKQDKGKWKNQQSGSFEEEEEKQDLSEKQRRREDQNSKPVEKRQKQETENDGDQVFEAYVGGLSFDAEEDDIQQLFQECGNGPSECKLLRRGDRKSKGIAFVKFQDEESLNEALQLNGKEHMGRTIQVEKAQGKGNSGSTSKRPSNNAGGESDSKTIFVGNLSWDTDEDSLSKFFKQCGVVSEVRIAKDQEGKARGFAHVEFSTSESAQEALQLNGLELDGRNIRVDLSAKREGGGRRNDGKFERRGGGGRFGGGGGFGGSGFGRGRGRGRGNNFGNRSNFGRRDNYENQKDNNKF